MYIYIYISCGTPNKRKHLCLIKPSSFATSVCSLSGLSVSLSAISLLRLAQPLHLYPPNPKPFVCTNASNLCICKLVT